MSDSAIAPVLEARGIVKIFGQHRALDDVGFSALRGRGACPSGRKRRGQVHADQDPDRGLSARRRARFCWTASRSPCAIRLHGARLRDRHGLSGGEPAAEPVGRRKTCFSAASPPASAWSTASGSTPPHATLLSRYGLDIDVRAELSEYSVAVQQIVAIARAVELSGKVLVLDEPTASLDRNEVQRLFDVVRGLKAKGLAIIFITHFLDQVFELADRVTILRNGKKVATQALNTLNTTDVVRMMLGKDVAFDHHPTALAGGTRGAVRVRVPGHRPQGRGALRPVGPRRRGRRRGGPSGLGPHRSRPADVRRRCRRRRRRSHVDGKPVTIRNPVQAVAAGFGFCPEDRKIDGIFGDLSVRENIIIALQAKLGWFKALNRDDQVELAGRYAEALDIRAANHDMPVKLLSGGNQQKVILARWLAIDPTFLILDEPTRGIDVGAHAEIVRTINRLREEGLALFVISSELDEVVAYSNRVVVMRDREMTAVVGDPAFPVHVYGVALAGANVISVALGNDDAFLERIRYVAEHLFPRPKVLILNYPHNPTAMTVDPVFFEHVVDLANEFEVAVIHDFAYGQTCFDGSCRRSLSSSMSLYLDVDFSLFGFRRFVLLFRGRLALAAPAGFVGVLFPSGDDRPEDALEPLDRHLAPPLLEETLYIIFEALELVPDRVLRFLPDGELEQDRVVLGRPDAVVDGPRPQGAGRIPRRWKRWKRGAGSASTRTGCDGTGSRGRCPRGSRRSRRTTPPPPRGCTRTARPLSRACRLPSRSGSTAPGPSRRR